MIPSVCLTMIVRDESKVLPRSVGSFLAVHGIDPAYCIVDGGSEDDSRDLIPELFGHVPGEVHLIPQEKPLRDFAGARNGALARGRMLGDWMFLLDADDEIRTDPGFVMPKLEGEAYTIMIRQQTPGWGAIEWPRLVLVRSGKPWRYVGRMHENLECEVPYTAKHLEGIWIEVHAGEGARSRNPRQKFLDDAVTLRLCLQEDPGNTRHMYYLAQSLKDAGMLEEAREAFLVRAEHLEGWDEETYMALLYAAEITNWLNDPLPMVVAAYLRAHLFRPQRAESLGSLALYLQKKEQWQFGAFVSALAMRIPRSTDRLFVNHAWTEWKAADIFAICSYYVRDFVGSRNACMEILNNDKLPVDQAPRIQGNLIFAEQALGV